MNTEGVLGTIVIVSVSFLWVDSTLHDLIGREQGLLKQLRNLVIQTFLSSDLNENSFWLLYDNDLSLSLSLSLVNL